jgi:hypothetical protein
MPDKNLMLRAMAVSAVVAFAILLRAAAAWRLRMLRLGRTIDPGRIDLSAALGVGLGFLAGCWLLMETPPRWPPREDLDRLLLVLLPAVVLVECVAAFVTRWWIAWALRLFVAAAAARILLHDSGYINDLSGPGSSTWTQAQQLWVLGGLAGLLAAVWAALALLLRRAPGRSVPLALALTSGAAAVTIMISGYLTGGQLGLALAGALAGTVAASLLLPKSAGGLGSLGVGLVLLFGLLVIGRFFGYLTTAHALLLSLGLLLCWVPEARYVVRLRPWLRGTLRVLLVALPVSLVVAQATQEFVRDSQSSSAASDQPTPQDYLDFKPP